jgi:hypothetical protein
MENRLPSVVEMLRMPEVPDGNPIPALADGSNMVGLIRFGLLGSKNNEGGKVKWSARKIYCCLR